MLQFIGLQICAFAIQILAGATLLHILTGLDYTILSACLVVIALTYSLLGGLRASVTTDVVQMGFVLVVVAVTIPWAVSASGQGVGGIIDGLGGITGKFTNALDPWVLYTFGIPSTVALLAGPLGDQMHWQRAYALRSNRSVWPTYLIGACIFIAVPLSLSVLGFLAANPSIGASWVIPSPQMVGPTVVAALLPKAVLLIFCAMLLCGLGSTLDSVLCAVSALVTVDLSDRDRPEASKVRVARWGMLATATAGLGLACVPGVEILHLWLFAGTFRAATMLPTIGAVFMRISAKHVFYAILMSLGLGGPLYVTGMLVKNPHLVTGGSIAVVLIGAAFLLYGRLSGAASDPDPSGPKMRRQTKTGTWRPAQRLG